MTPAPMIDAEYATCNCTAMKAPEESPDTEVCCGFAPYAGRLAGAANALAATNATSMRLAIQRAESFILLERARSCDAHPCRALTRGAAGSRPHRRARRRFPYVARRRRTFRQRLAPI